MDLNRLSSTEITNLWTHYIRETLAVCVSKYVLKCVKDSAIVSSYEFAMNLSNRHIEKLKEIFTKEEFPIPNGFTDEDVNLDAPSLFSEKFWLIYIYGMSMHGSSLYSLAFNSSARRDLRDFYYQCVNDSMDLYNMSIDALIEKGLYDKSPYFVSPERVDYITDLNYVTDVIGKRRPLNTMESGNIYFNLKKSMLTKTLVLGFSQVCTSSEIRKYLNKLVGVANKHIGLFSTLLLENNLHAPQSMDSEMTNSSVAPFSDKLMLFHAGSLIGVAITYYGYAAIMSMRADLFVHCETAITRDLTMYAKFGHLMIKNHWMEKPPIADDRQELS